MPILQELDKELEQRQLRESIKQERIARLENLLKKSDNQQERLRHLKALGLEYKSYSFDSAAKKSLRLLQAAKVLKDPCQEAQAQVLHAYVQLSAGVINPALDSLAAHPPTYCDSVLKAQYFFTLSKAYFELESFNPEKDNAQFFQEKGISFLDSSILLAAGPGFEKESFKAYKSLKMGNSEEAKNLYENLLSRKDLPKRQMAMEAACLASVYELEGDKEKAIRFYAQSALADEASSVREYTSLIRLANLLFEAGDIERSNRYITLSLRDANFFGSIQRKIQILEVLPLIKTQQLNLVNEKQNTLIVFSLLLFLFLVGCLFLVWLTVKQNREIKKNEQNLSQYSKDLKRKNTEIEEAQRIKEEYIGYFFQTNTRLINKIEKILVELDKANQAKNHSDIRFQLSQFKPDVEKKKLLRDFDKAFLSIFPSFVEEVNQLMGPQSQFLLEEENVLSNELRIIALMKLGLSSNEMIARSLGYSVNTIYSYKTKIRNRSLLSSEEFDKALMSIKSTR